MLTFIIYATSARLKGRGNQGECNNHICNQGCEHHDVGKVRATESVMFLCFVDCAELNLRSDTDAKHNPEEGSNKVSKVNVVGFYHGISWE